MRVVIVAIHRATRARWLRHHSSIQQRSDADRAVQTSILQTARRQYCPGAGDT